MEVYGRSVRTNMAAAVTVGSQELCQYLQTPVKEIIDAIMVTLEETPPELASDIFENGIVLTGGSSQLAGLAQLIHEVTGLRIVRANRPLDTVCIGLSRILESEGDVSPMPMDTPSAFVRLPFGREKRDASGASRDVGAGSRGIGGGRRK
jgi:rod shape-determining protein MreB